MQKELSNGCICEMLTVLEEHIREAPCVVVRPKMNLHDIPDALYRLLMRHGQPEFIRFDNGSEPIATRLQDWLEGGGTIR